MNNFQKKKIFVVCIAQLSIQLEKLQKFPLKSSDWNVLKKSEKFFQTISFKTKFLMVFIKPKHQNPDGCSSSQAVCHQLIWFSEYFGERNFMYHEASFHSVYLHAGIGPPKWWKLTYSSQAEILIRTINLSWTYSLGQTLYQVLGKYEMNKTSSYSGSINNFIFIVYREEIEVLGNLYQPLSLLYFF